MSASLFPKVFLSPPATYAKEEFIKNQRVAGLVLILAGIFASLFAPVTGGSAAIVGASFVAAGSVLIGASLIQEAVGNAYGCSRGKTKRVFAGVLLMTMQPVGWALGIIFWHLSDRANGRY